MDDTASDATTAVTTAAPDTTSAATTAAPDTTAPRDTTAPPDTTARDTTVSVPTDTGEPDSLDDGDAPDARPTERGELLWGRHLDPTFLMLHDLRLTATHEAVLAADFAGSIDVDGLHLQSSPSRGLVMRLDADGRLLWGHVLASEWTSTATALDLTADERVAFGGMTDSKTGSESHTYVGMLDAGGDPIWTQSFEATEPRVARVVSTPDGTIAFAMTFKYDATIFDVSVAGGPMYNAVLGRVAPDGTSGDAFHVAIGPAPVLAATDTRSYLGVHTFSETTIGDTVHPHGGAVDVLLVAYAPSGEPLWSRSFGGAERESVAAIALDADGNVYLAGSFGGTVTLGDTTLIASAVGTEPYVVSYTPEGQVRWARALPGLRGLVVSRLAIDADGSVYLAGTARTTLTIDGGSWPIPERAGLVVRVPMEGPLDTRVVLQNVDITVMAIDATRIVIGGACLGQLRLGQVVTCELDDAFIAAYTR